ncbi:MAG: TPM domain-containing protein [Rhodothermales bacterium]
MLRRCLPILLAGLLALTAHAQPAVPALTGRVVDRADVLSPGTERALTDLFAEHERATSNQVVVLTVPSLEGDTVEGFAVRVFADWGLGQADRDNGVLLLIARDDREMRIEVGFGLEGALTDAQAGRIIRSEFLPAFRNGDYDGGTLAGASAVVGTIEGTYEPADTDIGDEVPWPVRWGFGLFFGGMPLLAFAPTFFLAGRWGGLVFIGVFVVVGGGFLLFSLWGALYVLVGYVSAILVGEWRFRQLADWKKTRAKVRKALDENKGRRVKVDLGGFTYTAGGITQGGGSSGSGGGFSSGGSSFSGGGGSSGGGGASGSW